MNALSGRARSFLAGEALSFDEANALWRDLRDHDEVALARAVLTRLREVFCWTDSRQRGRFGVSCANKKRC